MDELLSAAEYHRFILSVEMCSDYFDNTHSLILALTTRITTWPSPTLPSHIDSASSTLSHVVDERHPAAVALSVSAEECKETVEGERAETATVPAPSRLVPEGALNGAAQLINNVLARNNQVREELSTIRVLVNARAKVRRLSLSASAGRASASLTAPTTSVAVVAMSLLSLLDTLDQLASCLRRLHGHKKDLYAVLTHNHAGTSAVQRNQFLARASEITRLCDQGRAIIEGTDYIPLHFNSVTLVNSDETFAARVECTFAQLSEATAHTAASRTIAAAATWLPSWLLHWLHGPFVVSPNSAAIRSPGETGERSEVNEALPPLPASSAARVGQPENELLASNSALLLIEEAPDEDKAAAADSGVVLPESAAGPPSPDSHDEPFAPSEPPSVDSHDEAFEPPVPLTITAVEVDREEQKPLQLSPHHTTHTQERGARGRQGQKKKKDKSSKSHRSVKRSTLLP